MQSGPEREIDKFGKSAKVIKNICLYLYNMTNIVSIATVLKDQKDCRLTGLLVLKQHKK